MTTKRTVTIDGINVPADHLIDGLWVAGGDLFGPVLTFQTFVHLVRTFPSGPLRVTPAGRS